MAPSSDSPQQSSSTTTGRQRAPSVSQPTTVAGENHLHAASKDMEPFPPTYAQTYATTGPGPWPTKPRPAAYNDRNTVLPSLDTITRTHGSRDELGRPQKPTNMWSGINNQKYPPPSRINSLNGMDYETSGNGGPGTASPDQYGDGRAPSVNLDDPDVRLAAEALGDLRADFVSSPPSANTSLPMSPAMRAVHNGRRDSPQQEPLFSLLTTSHPLIATTIGGASSAYGGAKNYSPRFKSSAEYVENYLTPIANTVGSVGRVTGVEGSVRWFLGAGRRTASSSSDVEAAGNAKKRRKIDLAADPPSNKRLDSDAMKQLATSQSDQSDLEMFPPTPKGDRRLSLASTVDTLPAYDEQRSPAYTETAETQRGSSSGTNSNAHWQSRLVMSTSGLGVAMSDESLRSLKYCLRWLRWANDHMGGVVGTLKTTLDQYDNHNGDQHAAQIDASERQEGDSSTAPPEQMALITPEQSRTELAARINVLKGDVLKTLQDVVNTVSKYAGGALPDNARVLVRRHLTSLPQRFRIATMAEGNGQGEHQDSESAMREGAQKVLVLAKEGLDMVAQVSGVLDGTIVSAEEWCERMGKRRPSSEAPARTEEGASTPVPAEAAHDVQMS